jgi:hypothetical protein
VATSVVTQNAASPWNKSTPQERDVLNRVGAAGPNDRDGVLYDAKKHWGSHLHIPLTYRQIEDGVPKAIAQRPKLLYLPRSERWEQNVDALRMMMDAQQEQVDIELEFQDVLKSGYIYGLGVGKALWRKEYALKRVQRRRMFRPNEFRPTGLQEVCTFDDPDFENVDVYDFMCWGCGT